MSPARDLHRALLAIHQGDLCDPCLRVLPVSGIAVTALNDPMSSRTFCATDAVAVRLDELQLDLGEGPCWQALSTARPVLIPDLHRCPAGHWPVFAAAAQSTPARALFVFPLLVGRTRVGTLSLYRTTAGPLGPAGVNTTAALAGTVAAELANQILTAPAPTDHYEPAPGAAGLDRGPISMATGVTMAQLDITPTAAFARLQAHALSAGTSMADVSRQVIAHQLRLPA